jgi:Family of unknown function (DUF5681)
MQTQNYEVGYKRPPRHTQFKPGESGNPNGRPKQKKSLPALLKEILFRRVSINENGKRRKVPYIEALVIKVAHMSVNGDPRARRDLLELIRRHPGAVKHLEPIRMIDDSMSPEEAAKAYAETLRAIPGLIDPDYEE